jgi:hypothetical protein
MLRGKEVSIEIQQIYDRRAALDEKIRNHPKRWLEVTDKEGDNHLVDCLLQYHVIEKRIREFGGDDEDVAEGKARRKEIHKLYSEKCRITKLVNRASRNEGYLNGLDYHSAELLDLFGRYYSVNEVISYIEKKYSYRLTKQQVEAWVRKNATIIDQKKAQYTLENEGFRVANETGRLQVLNDLLAKWQESNDKKLLESKTNVILRILEQARKEIKGNELKLTADFKIDINASIQASENVMAISKQLPINMLVIGMTAARQGLNPLVLMTQLASSYYSNVNGFNNRILGTEELLYPTNLIKTYDWNDLEQKHKSLKQQFDQPIQDIIEYQEVESEKAVVAAKSKEDILRKLREFKERTR